MSDWSSFLANEQDRFLSELMEFVKIPSVSASSEFESDVADAANWVARRITQAGGENVEIMQTGGHPCVYADWMHAGDNKPTILIYGHFDVQPAEPYELWDTPPFDPNVRDDKIFGRGASDDKGGMLIPIISFEAFKKTSGKLPINIKFLFEGQEEIGSPQLPEFVAENRNKLSCDMIFSSDGLQWTADEPNLVTGLKGLVGAEIKVIGPITDQHSGLHGGAIANPLMALSQLVSSMKDRNGKITINGFYDDVEDLTEEDRNDIARVPYDEAAYKEELKVDELHGEEGYSTRERLWARPTLDVNGIWGGYTGEGAKTVIASKAYAKISMRLVPNQDPHKITELFNSHFNSIAPKGVTVKVTPHHGGEPAVTPVDSIGYLAASDAYEKSFGVKPIPVRSGGSIPIVAMFEKELGLKTVLMGFGLDSDAIHSPNEHYGLFNFYKGIETIPYFFEAFAKRMK